MITGRLLGRMVGIDGPGDLLGGVVRDRLPPGWADEPGEPERRWRLLPAPDGWQAERAGEVFAGSPEPSTAVDALIGDVELWAAEHAAGLIAVHAGAVAVGGRAIVLPGRTRAGKSTLVAALVAAGAEYLSDEYALLRPDGLVQAYPRPINLRTPHGPRRLPVTGATAPMPVGTVAALRFSGRWEVRETGTAESALALLENAVAARSRPVEVMDAVQRAVAGAAGLAGTRGEADEAAALLLASSGA